MTPSQLETYLNRIIQHGIKISIMIWGAAGIGKSSIVAQIAKKHGIDFGDVRLSQLAPTDLRGLPVANDGTSKWYPPEFLPRTGKGILFLDELNMAPPALQGVAQQLILDRRVGSYVVPEGWYVWAAGNRKEDRAAVFEMPSPLANRFVHLQVKADLKSFKVYALENQVHEQIIAFLSFRSNLLHRLDPQQPAWCSPRSWVMASDLHYAALDIAGAVGESAATEFRAFVRDCKTLPSLSSILKGNGSAIAFPEEPQVKYAVTTGLATRVEDVEQAHNAFNWLHEKAGTEWINLFAVDMLPSIRSRGQMGALATLVRQDDELQQFLKDFRELFGF